MKRFLVAAALAIAAFCASAQTPSNDCKPAAVADVRAGLADGGAWAYWYCTDGFTLWVNWRALRADAVTPQLVRAAQAYAAGTNPAFLDTPMTLPANDPSLAKMRAAVAAAIAADNAPPAWPVWVVAKNGTTPTRPAYALANGARGALSSSRATVGATCDCSARVIEAKTVYCSVGAALVAVCTKQ